MKSYAQFKAISPARAIRLYERLNGGPVQTRDMIAFWLREGKIRARAQHVWESSELSIAEAWRREPDKEAHAKYTKLKKSNDVPTATWWKSLDWTRDVADWNLRRGRFHITTSTKPPTRIMLKRVRLHSDDIRKLLAPGFIDFSKSGIKKIDAWRMFWHEVVRLALKTAPSGSISVLSSFKSDDRVLDAITEALEFEEELLSDEKIEAISTSIANRQPFDLSPKSALEEIDLLRKALKFKREYNRKRSR
jgi:hypothetical protein